MNENSFDILDRLADRILNRLDRLEDKIDKLSDTANTNAIQLARNTISLEEHIKRTNLLEDELKTTKTEIKTHKEQDLVEEISKSKDNMEKSIKLLIKTPQYLYVILKWSLGIGTAGTAMYHIVKITLEHL